MRRRVPNLSDTCAIPYENETKCVRYPPLRYYLERVLRDMGGYLALKNLLKSVGIFGVNDAEEGLPCGLPAVAGPIQLTTGQKDYLMSTCAPTMEPSFLSLLSCDVGAPRARADDFEGGVLATQETGSIKELTERVALQIQGSVNGGFQTVVRVLSRDQIPLPPFNLIEPSFCLNFTSS